MDMRFLLLLWHNQLRLHTVISISNSSNELLELRVGNFASQTLVQGLDRNNLG